MSIVSTALVTMAVLSAAEPDPGTAAVSGTEALLEWADALESSQIDQVLSLYEQTDDVIIVHSTGELDKGMDAVRKRYREAFDEVVFDEVSLKDLQVRQCGDVAWAVCRLVADTKRHGDETKWRLEIRTSFVLRRHGPSWKIALEHSSPIQHIPRVRRRDE